uniref:Uncharacterized protein n=1 Tax=Vitis vinifera TaxID=29760 RepID=A5B1Z0_VITVI|nr:hypothetical protein VITISV_030025 [Vitis vinifera]
MAAHVLLGNPDGVAPDCDALLFFLNGPLLRCGTYPDPLIKLTRRASATDILAYPEPFCTVINFVDYSLNQRALAGRESAETPIGNHESNGRAINWRRLMKDFAKPFWV